MNYIIPGSTKSSAGLTFADSTRWDIIPFDDLACAVVSALTKVMRLQAFENKDKMLFNSNTFRRLIVQVDVHKTESTKLFTATYITAKDENTIICRIVSEEQNENYGLQLISLSSVISRDSHYRGGVLLHGALAEWNGKGVILAGPGGRGKTTASKRLPRPWHSFCDDTTLVVCDKNGAYWAHPWPTWSAFMYKGPGGSWDVQHAVPLRGIFFLEQDHKVEAKPIGTAQSVCLLNESSKQTQCFISNRSGNDNLRKLRLLRFDNVCKLAQIVPSYILRTRKKGAFWQEIERALNG